MTAPTIAKSHTRRRYDQPARLSPEDAAREIKTLARASSKLAKLLARARAARQGSGSAGLLVDLKEASAQFARVQNDLAAIVGGFDAEPVQISMTVTRTRASEARAATPAQPAGAASDSSGVLSDLVRKNELLDPVQFASRMGWTRQALSKALLANRVFYVMHGNTRLYPAFFADLKYERARIEEVSKALGALPGGAKLQFFLSRRGSLGGASVLESLAKGNVEPVLAAAQAFREG